MVNKFDEVVGSIIQKTEDDLIEWRRLAGIDVQANLFLKKFIINQNIEFDETESYVANYGNGFIYVLGDTEWVDVAVQPGEGKSLTPIISSASKISKEAKKLKSIITNKIDSPDDFLEDLLN